MTAREDRDRAVSGRMNAFAIFGVLAVHQELRETFARRARPMTVLRRLLIAATLCCGCDPQADGNYLGEPLATFDGHVSSAGVAPLEAAMLWQRGPPPSTDDQELATRAPVQTGFPARFTLHLYQPAPAAARRTLAPGQVPYARANAGAIPYGIAAAAVGGLAPAAPPGTTSPAANGPYGIDAHHWIVYLPTDVPPGSLMEWWLGGALAAGFHLMTVVAVDPACIPAEQLASCAAELARRGVPDDGTANAGTARAFCTAPYRLQPSAPGEQLVLELGTVGLGPGAGCAQ
jgi:hypothetical protein